MSTVWSKKISATDAARLGAGFAAAATTQKSSMTPFAPYVDKSGTILFAAASRSTTSSNIQLFFGPSQDDPQNKPPTLSIKVSAPSEEFEDPDTFSGGTTPLARDIETIADAVGPHSGMWKMVADNFGEMAKASDPTGAKFQGFRKMPADKLAALLQDDVLRGSDKQVTMHKPQFAPCPVKKYHKKMDANGDTLWVAQVSFDVKLFVDRTQPISDDDHAIELERYHPESSLRAFATNHPELMPSRFMFSPLVGGGKVSWTTALYSPYDSVSMHASVHFKPYRVGLYAKFERVTYTCYVDQIDVLAMIGSSGNAVVDTEVNSAQKMLLAAAMESESSELAVIEEEVVFEPDEFVSEDAPQGGGGKRKQKKPSKENQKKR